MIYFIYDVERTEFWKRSEKIRNGWWVPILLYPNPLHDEMCYRKTLPAKRLLELNLEHLEKGLKWAKTGDMPGLTAYMTENKCSFNDYTSQVCSNNSVPSLRRT